MRHRQDQIDREHAKDLHAVDSRIASRRFRPRLAMLDDDHPSRFELGSELDEFIDPDEPRPRARKGT
jgi:hypothetical protein